MRQITEQKRNKIQQTDSDASVRSPLFNLMTVPVTPLPSVVLFWRLIMLPLFSNLIGSSQITYLDNKRRPINRRSGTDCPSR